VAIAARNGDSFYRDPDPVAAAPPPPAPEPVYVPPPAGTGTALDLAIRNAMIAGALEGTADPLKVIQTFDLQPADFIPIAQHIVSEAQQEAQFSALASAGLNYVLPGLGTLAFGGDPFTAALQAVGGDFVADFLDEGGFEDVSLGDWSLPDIVGGLRTVSSVFQTANALMTDSGDPVPSNGGGSTMPVSVGGAIGASVISGGIWLGSYLARAFGRGAAGAIYTAANGIRVRISQLWPLVRRYGAQNVAGALGIGVGALGALLLEPGAQHGRSGRRRRRGISATDVRTTRRTIRQLKSLTRMAGIRSGGGGYRRRSSYIPPHRHRSYR
jgi:hypothetical protein